MILFLILYVLSHSSSMHAQLSSVDKGLDLDVMRSLARLHRSKGLPEPQVLANPISNKIS